MSVMRTGDFASLLAVSIPPNPAPIITMWGRFWDIKLSLPNPDCEILH
jgi:hypothetical protein